MEKRKKFAMITSTLGIFLIMLGVTYSFFNYTRTGVSNTIKVGRISFNSNQSNTVTLLNVFPIDKSDVNDSTDVAMVNVDIEGDTTYDEGVEYLLTVSNLTNTVGNKSIPIDVEVIGYQIGTNDEDYFDNRGGNSSIYKVLKTGTIKNNDQLLVGYITKGQTGIDGNVTIKAYLDKEKIAISDTYPEGEHTETIGEDEYEIIQNISNDMIEMCVDYCYGQGFDNYLEDGESLENFCDGTGTLYGRNIEGWLDSNWFYDEDIATLKQIGIVNQTSFAIRNSWTDGTTSTWVHGREVFTTEEWNNFQVNGVSFQVKVEANEGTWVDEPNALNTIKKNVDTSTVIDFGQNSSSTNGEGLYILPGTGNNTYPIYYYRGNINNNNVIFGDYCWQMVRTTDTGGIKMIYNGNVTGNGTACTNTTHSRRVLASDSRFNYDRDSISNVGYMNNKSYVYQSGTPVSGAYFGTSVEYGEYDINNPGTNVYRLVDDGNGSVGTTLDANHHYTCNSVAANGTCTQVRYYYYNSESYYYYIILTNGELVEDALYKMTGNVVNENIDVVARNQGYVLNNSNSTAKKAIESWFRANLTNEVDNTKTDYRPYLEDTIYCNDRSFKTEIGGTYYNTFLESGWNPNGGDLTKNLYFGTNNRYKNSWYSTTNVPTTTCPNENDRFSVSSTIAHLNYPVGLLTGDEVVMAGLSGNAGNHYSYYLYTGNYYWTMSPGYFNKDSVFEYRIDGFGDMVYTYVNNSFSLRPVISLKYKVEFEDGGDGTPTNPYVVKYN